MSVRDLDHQTMPPYEFVKRFETDLHQLNSFNTYNNIYPFSKVASFNEIPSVMGIYCLTFPNGMKYIGQSSNVRGRIFTHIKCILYSHRKSLNAAWYYNAKQTFNLQGDTEEQFNTIVSQLKIQICRTSEIEQAERFYLGKIYGKGLTQKFYNKEYYDLSTDKAVKIGADYK